MMKKLLMFALILGIGSLASAGLSLQINGNPDPTDSEICLATNQIAVIDILGTNLNSTEGYPYVVVAAQAAEATITGGTAVQGSLTAPQNGIVLSYFPLDAGMDGVDWFVGDSAAQTLPDGVVIQGIEYHADMYGDALIELWSTPDFVNFTLEDIVIIHQGGVPEPATIALLALGGLLIRRRK